MAHLYRWEREDFGQNTWDWERPWGTHWEPREHIGNLMGIHWELQGNMLGTKEKKSSLYSLSSHFFFLFFHFLSLHLFSYLFLMSFSFSMFPYYNEFFHFLSFHLFSYLFSMFLCLSMLPCYKNCWHMHIVNCKSSLWSTLSNYKNLDSKQVSQMIRIMFMIKIYKLLKFFIIMLFKLQVLYH